MNFKTIILGTTLLSCIVRTRASSTSCPIKSATSAASTLKSIMTDYKSGEHSVAYVTAPDEEVAKKIAHGLVKGKLAACVNIIPQVISIYEWDNVINEDKEVLMMIKTRSSKIEDLTKFVKENHPYDVCEVISVPIEKGNAPYLEWISKSVPK